MPLDRTIAVSMERPGSDHGHRRPVLERRPTRRSISQLCAEIAQSELAKPGTRRDCHVKGGVRMAHTGVLTDVHPRITLESPTERSGLALACLDDDRYVVHAIGQELFDRGAGLIDRDRFGAGHGHGELGHGERPPRDGSAKPGMGDQM